MLASKKLIVVVPGLLPRTFTSLVPHSVPVATSGTDEPIFFMYDWLVFLVLT